MAIGHTADKGRFITGMCTITTRRRHRGIAFVRSNTRYLTPIPEREHIQIFIPVTIDIRSPVAHIKPFQIIFIDQLCADHPFGSHLDRSHPFRGAVYRLIRVPEMLLPGKSSTFRLLRWEIIIQQSLYLRGISWGTSFAERVGRVTDGKCLMDRCVMEQLAVERIHIHISPPDDPAVTFRQQVIQNSLLFGAQGKRGSGKQSRIETHFREISQPVVAELLLRPVLVETPVALDPFRSSGRYFRNDRVAGSLHQRVIVQQQSFHQYISGQPYLILSRHAEAGVIHHLHRLFQLIGCHLRTKQDKSRAKRFGNADLVIPPVLADRLRTKPIAESLMNNRRETGRPRAGRAFGVIEFRQFQHPVGILLGIPAGTFRVGIIDIRPCAVLTDILHIGFDTVYIEWIPLMQLHHHLIRHFRFGRNTGQYAVQQIGVVVGTHQRLDIVLPDLFQLIGRCLRKRAGRHQQ